MIQYNVKKNRYELFCDGCSTGLAAWGNWHEMVTTINRIRTDEGCMTDFGKPFEEDYCRNCNHILQSRIPPHAKIAMKVIHTIYEPIGIFKGDTVIVQKLLEGELRYIIYNMWIIDLTDRKFYTRIDHDHIEPQGQVMGIWRDKP